MRHVLLLVTLLCAPPGCAALARMGDQTLDRPAGRACVRYDFIYRRPHLGGDRWGDPELVEVAYPAGPGSYRYYGEYVACPDAAPAPDPQLVELWQAWRAIRRKDRTTYWHYHEEAVDGVVPRSLRRTAVATRPIEGALYQFETYDAVFNGCDYWATEDKKYKCAP